MSSILREVRDIANGIYLYQVVLYKNGKEYKQKIK